MIPVLIGFLLVQAVSIVHLFINSLTVLLSSASVEKVQLGLNPSLFRKHLGGVVFSIGAIPLGGYLTLHNLNTSGEDLDETASTFQPEVQSIQVETQSDNDPESVDIPVYMHHNIDVSVKSYFFAFLTL